MENSKLQEQIINLGKLLVDELGLDNRSDTLARWMAHFIAEKMIIAENSGGSSKAEIQRECFDIILKLWDIRWNFPESNRPFKDFELIFDFIQNIDPDSQTPRYFVKHARKDAFKKEEGNPVKQWLDLGKEIDVAAKNMMKFILEQAALNASDTKTKQWLAGSTSLPHTDDIRIIEIILGQETESEDDREKKYEIESIKKRIDEIETLKKISDVILKSYQEKLTNLQKDE